MPTWTQRDLLLAATSTPADAAVTGALDANPPNTPAALAPRAVISAESPSRVPTPAPRILYVLAGDLPNLSALTEQLPAQAQLLILDADTDGIEQLATTLAARPQASYDAIHMLGHGDSGRLALGNATLSQATLARYQPALAVIGRALTADGDLLLYGCNVAQGEVGAAFIADLAQATDADVAASTNLTGAGGDWVLESAAGTIETAALAAPADDRLTLSLSSFNTLITNKLWSTMAEFAVAAYEDTLGNSVRAALLATGKWEPPNFTVAADETAITYSNGYYKYAPTGIDFASAFVARCADTLVLSLTGSDDWVDWASDIINMNPAFDALRPLLTAVDGYVANPLNGIRQVYVVGHSLGGALAQAYLLGLGNAPSHPDTATASYRAYTFGAPGFNDDWVIGDFFPGHDDRVIQLEATTDPIADLLTKTGNTVHVQDSSAWSSDYQLAHHGKDRYLAIARFLDSQLQASPQDHNGQGFDIPSGGQRLLMPIDGSAELGWTIGTGNEDVYDDIPAYDFPIAFGGIGNDILGRADGLGDSDADTLYGGTGNDTYYVDHAGDIIVERANAGRDQVYATVSYRLAAETEDLTLSPDSAFLAFDAALDGTGNALANRIQGNAAANALFGGSGNDTLDGGLGMDQIYGEAGDDVLYAADGGDLLRGGTGNDSYNVRRVDYDALISLDVPTYTLFDEAGALDRLYLWDDGQMNLNGLEDLSFRAVGSDLWIDLDIDLTLDDDDEGRVIVKNQANTANALESLYLADKNGVVFGNPFALTSVWSALLANGSDDWFRMTAPASGSDPSAIAIVPGSGTGGSGAGNTQGGANTLSLDAPLVLRGQVGEIGSSISYTITPAMKGAIQLELDLAWLYGDSGEDKTYRVDVMDASQTPLESFRINGDETFRVGVVGPTALSIRLTNTGDTREVFNVLNGQFTLTVRQADKYINIFAMSA